jgi:hypothetical protein
MPFAAPSAGDDFCAPQRSTLNMADAALVDALARLQLEALRAGYRIQVHASAELIELIGLCGLSGVLGEPEQREELRRVEEERHLPDPAA